MPTKNQPGSPQAWTDPDDAPTLTAAMRQDAEVFDGNTFLRRGRGRPPTGYARELVSFRLDRDVLAKLREAGPGWQSQVNGLLRAGLGLEAAPQARMAAERMASDARTGKLGAKRGQPVTKRKA